MAEITYRQNGDYLIPNLKLKDSEKKPLGKYGKMRKAYLKEHNPILWNHLTLSEKLYDHLHEVEESATSRMELLLSQLMKQYGVTEELKAKDQMKWVQLMNSIHHTAEETVLNELIYS